MTFESFETVLLTCVFIMPGFIIDGTISIFVPPKKKNDGLHFLTFLMYSIVHCAVFSWLYILIWDIRATSIGWFLFIICATAIIASFFLGVLIGLFKKFNLLRRFLNKMHFNVSHNIETSWDYVFSLQKASFVVILLNDDTEIYGYCGENSFVSSRSEEHDLFIEKMYDKDWNLIQNCEGLYISKDQVKTINFYRGGENDVKEK